MTNFINECRCLMSNRKRKNSLGSEPESDPAGPKRSKMSDKLSATNENLLKALEERLIAPLGVKIDNLAEQLKVQTDEIKGVKERMDNFDSRMDNFEKTQTETNERIKREIKQEIRNEISDSGDVSYHVMLIGEINKLANNVIVSGLGRGNQEALFRAMCIEQLKMDQASVVSMQIRGHFFLGKSDNVEKLPPVCFKLGSVDDRTSIFNHTKNLKKGCGINIEKDVPTCYRAKYKLWKAKARKDKSFINKSTRVDFNGHILQKKWRMNADEAWTIEDSYFPTPAEFRKHHLKKGNVAEGGHLRPSIDEAQLDQARRTIRIINNPIKEVDNLVAAISGHLQEQQLEAMTVNITANGATSLIFDTADVMRSVKNTLVKDCKEIEGRRVYFEIYEKS